MVWISVSVSVSLSYGLVNTPVNDYVCTKVYIYHLSYRAYRTVTLLISCE